MSWSTQSHGAIIFGWKLQYYSNGGWFWQTTFSSMAHENSNTEAHWHFQQQGDFCKIWMLPISIYPRQTLARPYLTASQHRMSHTKTWVAESMHFRIAPFRLLTDLRDANSWGWAPPSTPQVANRLWTTTSQPSTGCCKSFSNSKLKIEKNDTTAQFPSCPYSSWFFKDMSLANFAPNLRNKLEYRGPANRGAQALNSTALSTRVSSHGWLY